MDYSEQLFKDKAQFPILLERSKLILINEQEPLTLKKTILLGIRKATSIESSPPIQEIIDSEIIPILVECSYHMDIAKDEESLINILWILTNVASGNSQQTTYIVQNKTLDLFIHFAQHENLEIASQALWGLGNIAGDNAKYRDLILDYNAIDIICRILDRKPPQSKIGDIAWVLSNMIRGKPFVNYQKVNKSWPYIIKQIKIKNQMLISLLNDSNTSHEAQIDLLWACSYLTECDTTHCIQDAINYNIFPTLIKYFTFESTKLIPCLRAIGNICAGDDRGVDLIINCGFLDLILNLLISDGRKLIEKKEAAWTLSNIAAGTANQQVALATHKLFSLVMNQTLQSFLTRGENSQGSEKQLDYFKEVNYIISNLYSTNKEIIYNFLIQNGVIQNWINTMVQLQDQIQSYSNKIQIITPFLEAQSNCCRYLQNCKQLKVQIINETSNLMNNFIRKLIDSDIKFKQQYLDSILKMYNLKEFYENKEDMDIENNENKINSDLEMENEKDEVSENDPELQDQQEVPDQLNDQEVAMMKEKMDNLNLNIHEMQRDD